jgi:RPA family protein
MFKIRKTRHIQEWTIRTKDNNRYVILSKHNTLNEAKNKRNELLEEYNQEKIEINPEPPPIEDNHH